MLVAFLNYRRLQLRRDRECITVLFADGQSREFFFSTLPLLFVSIRLALIRDKAGKPSRMLSLRLFPIPKNMLCSFSGVDMLGVRNILSTNRNI